MQLAHPRFNRALPLILAATALTASSASAIVVDGSFETGLAGFLCVQPHRQPLDVRRELWRGSPAIGIFRARSAGRLAGRVPAVGVRHQRLWLDLADRHPALRGPVHAFVPARRPALRRLVERGSPLRGAAELQRHLDPVHHHLTAVHARGDRVLRKVCEVQFCGCNPAVTVEVRTYTHSKLAASKARPAWFVPGGNTQASDFNRDERGVYQATYGTLTTASRYPRRRQRHSKRPSRVPLHLAVARYASLNEARLPRRSRVRMWR